MHSEKNVISLWIDFFLECKHVETEQSFLHELTCFLKYHTTLIFKITSRNFFIHNSMKGNTILLIVFFPKFYLEDKPAAKKL